MKYICLRHLPSYRDQLVNEELVKWVEENVKEPHRGYTRWGVNRSLCLISIELDSEQAVIFRLKFGL